MAELVDEFCSAAFYQLGEARRATPAPAESVTGSAGAARVLPGSISADELKMNVIDVGASDRKPDVREIKRPRNLVRDGRPVLLGEYHQAKQPYERFSRTAPPQLEPIEPPKLLEPETVYSVSSLMAQIQKGGFNTIWSAGRVITVAFPRGTETTLATAILETASLWSQVCNVVLQDVGNQFDEPGGYPLADIRIRFDTDRRASLVGRTGLARSLYDPTMLLRNFDTLDRSNSDEAITFRRVVLHEFGHALGLLHEHQHPEVELVWNPEAILDDLAEHGWDMERVELNITGSAFGEGVTYIDHDQTSIMQYKIPDSWVEGGYGTDENHDLSPLDGAFARALYPFEGDATIVETLGVGTTLHDQVVGPRIPKMYQTPGKVSGNLTFEVKGATAMLKLVVVDGSGNTLVDVSGSGEIAATTNVVDEQLTIFVTLEGATGKVEYSIGCLDADATNTP